MRRTGACGANRAGWIAVATGISLLFLVQQPSVTAHTEYHYAGAQTTARYDGAYAWIEVTNANVRPDTFDFIANRIMMKNSALTEWIEVGWAEVGWRVEGQYPEQWVYVYDSVSADWHFYDSLSIGSHVDVRIVKGSSCDIGDPTCLFIAQVWNHTSGAWETLRSVTLPMDRAYLEEFTEVYEDPEEPAAHMAIDLDANDLDWFETERRFADGTWNLWAPTNTVADDSTSVYCTNWIGDFYRFNTYKGSC